MNRVNVFLWAAAAVCVFVGATIAGDPEPKTVLLAIAEKEYKTADTLPVFAERELHARHGYRIIVCGIDPNDPTRLAGFAESLPEADVVILSIRRRALHPDEMVAFKAYLAAGKPVLGIRTSNHAFFPRGDYPRGYATWNDFDPQVLGGNYDGHHGSGPKVWVSQVAEAEDHPILKGVYVDFLSHGSLYMVNPLKDTTTPLLVGQIPGKPAEAIAWTHRFGDSKIFYTSLGHPDDFKERAFVRLLTNAVQWAAE